VINKVKEARIKNATNSMIKFKKKLDSHTHDSYDAEVFHSDADDLLCEILIKEGYEEMVEIFQSANKWYA